MANGKVALISFIAAMNLLASAAPKAEADVYIGGVRVDSKITVQGGQAFQSLGSRFDQNYAGIQPTQGFQPAQGGFQPAPTNFSAPSAANTSAPQTAPNTYVSQSPSTTYVSQSEQISSNFQTEDGVRTQNLAINLYNEAVPIFNAARYEQAEPLLARAVATDDNMEDAHALLAECFAKNGKPTEALREFKRIEKSTAWQKEMSLDRALCGVAVKDYALACQSFQKFIEQEPAGELRDYATRLLAITQHDFISQPNDDYLADASSSGVRRWKYTGQPLRVYIDDKSAVPGYRPEFRQGLEQSFKDWSTGTNGKVKFVFTENASEAQIKCSWTNKQSDLEGENELGLTRTLCYQDNGAIFSAEIKLLVLTKTADAMSDPVAAAKCVALHEIGHALGLQHSKSGFDTMYPEAPPAGFEFPLTHRDLNTVVALYSRPTTESISSIDSVKSTQACRR